LLLLASLFVQTIEQAFASELTTEENTPVLPVVTDDTINRIEASNLEDLPIPEIVAEVTADEGMVSESSPAPEIEVATTSTESAPDEEAVVDVLPDSPPIEFMPEDASSTTASTTATTTDLSVPTLTVESDTMIQFDKANCLAVEDGSYYCQETESTPTPSDRFFAAPDADGDLEIYLERGGELTQITSNTYDDAAPVYDGASDSIVWHRSINDVYQIIVYDVASGEETQLTDTTTNNMEPYRYDNYITWQFWQNDAWQIMLYDGGDTKTLTETYGHNLAPTIRNGLVVWHRIASGEKTIEVYNIKEGSYVTINDTEGGSIGNPRMVLVYDAQMENGDVVTRGYDMITGEITTFSAEPAELPEEIPEPDATGETRALINAKNQSDEDTDLETLQGTSTDMLPTLDISTTTTDLTLDLSSGLNSGELTDVEIVAEIPSAEISDLVIPPFTPDIATVTE
jgi:hypothetical protein